MRIYFMWVIFVQERVTEEQVRYTAYGVRRGGCEIADICTDRSGIEELAGLMNRYDASEINAADIVEDFIAAR